MAAVVDRPRRVRPWLRRAAIGAFVILVPVAAHTAWDHYEARRLARIVAELRAKNELPVPVAHGGPAPESRQNAARYYEAAGALVLADGVYGATGLLWRLDRVSDSDRPQLVRDIAAWVEGNTEAETLLARATDLPFAGYAPGTGYNYRVDRLFRLARLANLRTRERLERRDTEAAVGSIVRQVRLLRPLAAAGTLGGSVSGLIAAAIPALGQVGPALEQSPSEAALLTLQSAIREQDNDAAIEQSLLGERAFHLRNSWDESAQWYARHRDGNDVLWYLLRPFLTRMSIYRLDIMSQLLTQARQPWPVRLHVAVPPQPSSGPRGGWFPFFGWDAVEYQVRSSYKRQAVGVATALACARAADAAIAIERYRRAHDGSPPDSLEQLVPGYLAAVPIDPFSGQPIRYATRSDRYVVYSFGTNERDDGGWGAQIPVRPSGAVDTRSAVADFGIAIALSSRPR